jgi:two-component system sensor histidine kinase HydH
MEQMVISDFEKHRDFIEKALKEKFGSKYSNEDFSFIIDLVSDVVKNLIQLMREGKSQHEKFFSDIILNSIDAIIGFDNDFKIFLWNKGAENIYGYKKEEVMGKDFAMLLPAYKLRQGEKELLINEVIKKGFLANYETERITKSGKLISVSISRFAIYNENNEMIGSVGIVRDITKVKKLEKELKEKENLALIGEVVSSIAHSLSNPLNIISGNADYLLLDKGENDKEYEELKTILDEATRITKSIRHLLNFSRPVKINKQKVDFNFVINEVLKNFRYIIGNKKISIKKNLKEIDELYLDSEQIQEVISNLLTNAVQAIPFSGEVKIKSYQEDSQAVVEISDTGTGIPNENIDKIFLPFFSSKEYGKGTGLGLAITKRIIKEHGGEVNVKSQVGKGTTFILSIPINNESKD